jgi:hypothetical protein
MVNRRVLAVLGIALASLIVLSIAHASEIDQATKLTISQSVQIPTGGRSLAKLLAVGRLNGGQPFSYAVNAVFKGGKPYSVYSVPNRSRRIDSDKRFLGVLPAKPTGIAKRSHNINEYH